MHLLDKTANTELGLGLSPSTQGTRQERLLCPCQKDPSSQLHLSKGSKRNDPKRAIAGTGGDNSQQMQRKLSSGYPFHTAGLNPLR